MADEHRREIWRRATNRYYQNHKEKCLMKNEKFRKIYLAERRCVACSVPLIDGELTKCTNCTGTIQKEFAYAKGCLQLAEIV